MNAVQAPLWDREYHPTWPQPFHLVPLHPHFYADFNVPCHFLKLPTELRQEIIRYSMPEHPIEQHSLVACTAEYEYMSCTEGSRRDQIAKSVLNLLLGFNREIYHEVKDVFYSTATFVIHVGRNGVDFCNRRILGPMGPVGQDGGVYLYRSMNPRAIGLFIQQFPWNKVRNYQVNLAFRKRNAIHSTANSQVWDSQVELYDIRDYAAVVVSGILSKARQLDKLQVRVKITDAHLGRELPLDAAKVLIEPFERLRCVRNPQLMGIYREKEPVIPYCPHANLRNHCHCRYNCVRPPPPRLVPRLLPGTPLFDQVATPWEQNLALKAPFNILPDSPLIKLFVEFKEFHNKLTAVVPDIARSGSQCFLHRARVARERGDIAHFREVAAELMACWRYHVQLHEAQTRDVNGALERMMAADTYPGGRNAMTRIKQEQ